MSTPTILRNASLQDLAQILQVQHDSRFDVVAPASNLRFEGGNLMVAGADAEITMEGVTAVETCLTPTAVCDEGLADRLGVPIGYVRRMRETGEADLLDHNLNTWLRRSNASYLVRGFKADEADDCGIARAFLSDRYNVIDNLDVLMAALAGIREVGGDARVTGCDLSERRMTVRIEAPSIQALAPALLRNYRSPFTGKLGADNPVVFAGFVLSNSETGGGAFSLTPRLVVQVCNNGMTIKKDALRQVHLGSRMDEGLIRWSDETRKANVDLVTKQAADAVRTFLNVDYVKAKLDEIAAEAGVEIPGKFTEVVERVGKSLAFTKDEREGILEHFLMGGDRTAGGIMAAVTSFAQTVSDPDRANEVEEKGLEAMSLAAAAA